MSGSTNLFSAEFINKMIKAKQLERDAFMSLFPDNVKEHLDVIENELKAIVIETWMNKSDKKETTAEKAKKSKGKSKVKSIIIESGDDI